MGDTMGSKANALLLHAEITNCVTVMRGVPRWSLIPRQYSEEEDGEEPLLDEFKLLRRKVFTWNDWSLVEPMEYLEPFLEVVRSPEVSGPVTGVALTGLNRMLSKYIFGDSAKGAAQAMQAIAEAVTECKYESADAASDEVVLFKILQVLLSCVKCPGGCLLTDDNIKSIFEACYRIGQLQSEGGKSLLDSSQQTMHEIVSSIFSRLDTISTEREVPEESIPGTKVLHELHQTPLPMTPTSATSAVAAAAGAAQALPTTPPAAAPAAGQASSPRGDDRAQQPTNGDAEAGADGNSTAEQQDGVPAPSTQQQQQFDGGANREQHPPAAQLPDSPAGAEREGGQPAAQQSPAAPSPEPRLSFAATNGIVSVAAPPDTSGTAAEGEGAGDAGAGAKAGGLSTVEDEHRRGPKSTKGYGLGCITTIFEYIISWVASDKEDEVVFGLSLAVAALNAGGQGFERHRVLLDLVLEHLCQALYEATRFNNLTALTGVCQASLALYMYLGEHLLLQLEAVIGGGLLRIAEGKGRVESLDMQEAALEGLLDFVNQPQFLQDCYINLDCYVERTNLFENTCALLSKTAFPVSSPLGSVHLLSLDGLFAILTTLANRCDGAANREPLLHAYHDPAQFPALWDALCDGNQPPIGKAGMRAPSGAVASWVDVVRREKYLKGRMAVAADHFNRDYKKGFQFLQSINLLPQEDPMAVAKFLRMCPGLSKTMVGELLGEAEPFYLQVLEAFTHTFDFTGQRIDTAIRSYLETFRLPGEAQKINRIMESFGKHFHEQSPNTFKDSDAVYVLAYSIIMLNTDLHNEQIKTKMTAEEFIRNNRGINGGKDLPQAMLRGLYDSIRRSEIKIYSNETNVDSNDISSVFWTELVLKSRQQRGHMLRPADAANTSGLDRDMFSLIWGPTLAAVSVVMDHSSDMLIVQQALEGVKLAAKMASYHQTDQVMDSLVVSLSKFTLPLNPAAPKPTVAFGEDGKARKSMEAIFMIASLHGDSLRSGWRNVVDIVMRLYKLGLLPSAVFALEGEDEDEVKARVPRYAPTKRTGSSGSLLSRAISSLISIESSQEPPEQPSNREVQATQRTLACIEACVIPQVFADSRFLLEGSLVELAAAVRAAAGPLPPPSPKGNSSHAPEDLSVAEAALELLVTLALRNRDRLLLVWPGVHGMLAQVMDERSFKANNPLVERAVFGLLRVCQRLLPYRPEAADALLASLKLICRLNANVAWDLTEQISAEVLALVKASAGYIRSADGWNTICLLLASTSIHPRATGNVFEALGVICGDPALLSEVNYGPLLDTSLRFVEQYSKEPSGSGGIERSVQALQFAESLQQWLLRWAAQESPTPRAAEAAAAADAEAAAVDSAAGGGAGAVPRPSEAERLQGYWLALVGAMCKYGQDENPVLRNNAIEALKRILMSSDALHLPPAAWVACVEDCVSPLAADLAGYVSSKARGYPGADKSLRLAVSALAKAVLQYMPLLLQDDRFPELWNKVLIVLQHCTRNGSEELAEAVPEAVKNMLLVMAARGVLRPEWKDAEGHNLWDMTWAKAKTISSGLTPALLTTSGIPGFEPPEPPPAPPAAQQPASPAGYAAAAVGGAGPGLAVTTTSGAAVEDEVSRRDVLMVNDTSDGSVSVTSYTADAEPSQGDAAADAAATPNAGAHGDEGPASPSMAEILAGAANALVEGGEAVAAAAAAASVAANDALEEPRPVSAAADAQQQGAGPAEISAVEVSEEYVSEGGAASAPAEVAVVTEEVALAAAAGEEGAEGTAPAFDQQQAVESSAGEQQQPGGQPGEVAAEGEAGEEEAGEDAQAKQAAACKQS